MFDNEEINIGIFAFIFLIAHILLGIVAGLEAVGTSLIIIVVGVAIVGFLAE